jgi:hypothetical protein
MCRSSCIWYLAINDVHKSQKIGGLPPCERCHRQVLVPRG